MNRLLVMLAMGAATHGLLLRAEPEQTEEREVVASVCIGRTELSLILEAGDPFGGMGKPPRIDLRKALRPWEGERPASRFVGAEDRLLDLTPALLGAEGGALHGSWVLYNESTRRLVVRGTRAERGKVESIMQAVADDSPVMIEVRARLLTAKASEVAGVDWTAESLQDRLVEAHSSATATARPGQVAELDLAVKGETTHLRIEPNIGADRRVVDLRLQYDSSVESGAAKREVRVTVGTVGLSGREILIELGSPDDAQHTLLLGVQSVVRFLDGTPCWQWMEHEDPATQPDLRPTMVREEREPVGRKLEDGMVLGTWIVPPTFLNDMEFDGGDPDPFREGGELLGEGGKVRQHPVVAVAPPEIADEVESVALVDVTRVLRETGIDPPPGGWIYYAPRTSLLYAKLDPANSDLLDQLLNEG